MTRQRLSVAGAALLLLAAAPPDAARKARMDRTQDAIDAIYDALAAKDSAGVATQTQVIDAAFTEEAASWQAAGKPDRAGWASQSGARAQAISAAAARGDWAGANAALTALNQPCRACHDVELPAKH